MTFFDLNRDAVIASCNAARAQAWEIVNSIGNGKAISEIELLDVPVYVEVAMEYVASVRADMRFSMYTGAKGRSVATWEKVLMDLSNEHNEPMNRPVNVDLYGQIMELINELSDMLSIYGRNDDSSRIVFDMYRVLTFILSFRHIQDELNAYPSVHVINYVRNARKRKHAERKCEAHISRKAGYVQAHVRANFGLDAETTYVRDLCRNCYIKLHNIDPNVFVSVNPLAR